MRVCLWTNCDLDGVGSTIIVGNVFEKFEYIPVFFGNFEEKYQEWYIDNYDNYDKIFIVGIPLTQSLINKIDDKKIIFISDNNENVNSIDSKVISQSSSSCSKILFKLFNKKYKLSNDIKKLIAIIDDYNSYSLKTKESKVLNAVYRKSGSRKFHNFVNRFWNGFDKFTETEKKLAVSFYNELNKECEDLSLYSGEFKGRRVIATFAKVSANEVAHKILENYNCEIAIIVNLDTKFVSFRKSKSSDFDLKIIAENLCNGGGSEYSSGGKITDKFALFTQSLKEI